MKMTVKTKKRPRSTKIRINPFVVTMAHMPEEQRAKVIDDALVYVGLADARFPSRLYIASADFPNEVRDTDYFSGLSNWIHDGESLAILRPGWGCRLAIDQISPGKRNEAYVTRVQLLNSGELDVIKYKYRRRPMWDGVDLVCNSQLEWSLPHPSRTPGYNNYEIYSGSQLEADGVIKVAIELWARKRRMWSTFLSEDGLDHSIGLFTDASSLKEMYKLREKPDGRSRRAALLHLVSGHWRLTANATEDKIFIERHLRGAREFEWFGLKATVAANIET